jgi:hypothetical protein
MRFRGLPILAVLAASNLVAATAHAEVTRTIYAQMLVDELVREHPELLAVAMHATAPGAADSTIVASYRERVGAKSEADGLEVIQSNKPLTRPSSDRRGYEVLMPLRDVSDRTIGALGLVYRTDNGRSEASSLESAIGIRNWLRLVIPSKDKLFDPFTRGWAPGDILAQKLAMQAMERHPDILVVAVHITPPGGSKNKVVGINEPNFIGRDSDEVDTEIEKNGKTIMQVIPETHRMEVHMPMRAADGSLVGTICTVYLWQDESQTADFFVRSLAMRDELQPRVPSYEALFKP